MTAPAAPAHSARGTSRSVLPLAAAVLGWGLLVVLLLGRMRNELAATLHRDEAIAWTYASLPLDEIPGALAYDVNPPLYFLALHGWLGSGGSGATFLRLLSLAAIVLAAGVAFDAARRLAGTRGGWLAGAFVLLAPSTVALAGLARPYALAFLLGVIAVDAAIAMLRGGRWPALAVLSISAALLPLTHYWAGLLLGAVMLALATTALVTRQRWIITRVLVAVGIALLAVLPWSGTLATQLGSHPLAAHQPPTAELLGRTLTLAAGGGPAVWVLGVAAAGAGVAWFLRRGADGPAGASVDVARRFVWLLAGISVGIVGVLWLVSQVRPLFSPNYAFIVLAPVAVLVGVEMSRRWWTLVPMLTALALVAGLDFGRSVGADDPWDRDVRGPEQAIGRALEWSTGPGDVVVTSPGRVLAIRYYVGPDRDYVTPIGRVHDGRFDYRNRVDRLSAVDAYAVAERIADQPAGTRIAFVHDAGAPWDHPYWRTLDRRMDQMGIVLARSPGLELTTRLRLPGPNDGINVRVYRVADESTAGEAQNEPLLTGDVPPPWSGMAGRLP